MIKNSNTYLLYYWGNFFSQGMSRSVKIGATLSLAWCIFWLWGETTVWAQGPGTLDSSFNGTGIVTTDLGNNDGGHGVALQADGKIVTVGVSQSGSKQNITVVRYNSNGSLDSSFNGTGIVTTSIGSGNDYGYGVALQSDSKIVVAGYSTNGSKPNFAVVRYNPNGSLDGTFNGTGIVTTSIGSSYDYGYGVALQTDGKIVVTGQSYSGTKYNFAVARYNSTGTLDTSFNGTGVVTTSIGNDDYGFKGIVQSDSKIIMAGYSFNGIKNNLAVVRYNSNGTLDGSFNGTGIITTSISSGYDYGYAVAQQTDGKIVAVGYGQNGASYDMAVVRYNVNGSLDTTFDTDGIVTTPINSTNNSWSTIALQTDGKIVTAGHSRKGVGFFDFAVVRYNSNGSLDSSFNSTGIVTTPIGSASSDFGYGIALQTDGKIVVTGYGTQGVNSDIAVVRYGNLIQGVGGVAQLLTPTRQPSYWGIIAGLLMIMSAGLLIWRKR